MDIRGITFVDFDRDLVMMDINGTTGGCPDISGDVGSDAPDEGHRR